MAIRNTGSSVALVWSWRVLWRLNCRTNAMALPATQRRRLGWGLVLDPKACDAHPAAPAV